MLLWRRRLFPYMLPEKHEISYLVLHDQRQRDSISQQLFLQVEPYRMTVYVWHSNPSVCAVSNAKFTNCQPRSYVKIFLEEGTSAAYILHCAAWNIDGSGIMIVAVADLLMAAVLLLVPTSHDPQINREEAADCKWQSDHVWPGRLCANISKSNYVQVASSVLLVLQAKLSLRQPHNHLVQRYAKSLTC